VLIFLSFLAMVIGPALVGSFYAIRASDSEA